MKDVGIQMQTLDDFVTRARSQNAQHHDSHIASLSGLSRTVKSSYSDIGSRFNSTYERAQDLGAEMSTQTNTLNASLVPLNSILRQPLAELRTNVTNATLQEYQPTGETPQKIRYQYPADLPRTDSHDALLATLRRPLIASPTKLTIPVVFNDAPAASNEVNVLTPSEYAERKPTGRLREININTAGREKSAIKVHKRQLV